MNPFHYFGRFIGTVSGAFLGPLFMIIGFFIGLIIDIVLQKYILNDDMGTDLIGPLFHFWGRWIVHSGSLNQISLEFIKNHVEKVMRLNPSDKVTAFDAFNRALRDPKNSDSIEESLALVFPKFPLGEAQRIEIMMVCKNTGIDNPRNSNLLAKLASNLDLKMIIPKKEITPLEHSYSVLGLDPSAGFEKAKKAFKKLAKEFHPDITPKNQGSREFLKIQEAWDFIQKKEKNEN